MLVRGSFYRALKKISHANCVTIGALVQQLVTHEFNVFSPESSEANDLYNSIIEIKDVGIILNNYTKQINANVSSRKQIDSDFLSLYKAILNVAKSCFFEYRDSNYKSFFLSFKLKHQGEFKKVNGRLLTPKKWHNLHLCFDEDTISILNSKSNEFNIAPPKYVSSLVSLFLNQGNLFDKETKALLGFLNKSLYKIKVNSFQIYRNKKSNASQQEQNISKQIIELTNELIVKLKDDPILKNGRDFSYDRFSKTIGLFPGIK